MKILLAAINAKHIHSNLAVRYLKQYVEKYGYNAAVCEFTINQQKAFIISEIFKEKPDILGFSCYIWNIGLIEQLMSDIRKIMPHVTIVLGGPEAGFNEESMLTAPDYVIKGQGEQQFLELLHKLREGSNIYCKHNEPFNFKHTVFPYNNDTLPEGRIIYYETQRGCPFKCSYCLSADGSGVTFLSMDRVYKELSVFLNNRVNQVKFVDRTFNCNKTHRSLIWEYIIKNDNGITGFHFEIKGELIDDTDFDILKRARKGLIQFEIGVQSTCIKTLCAINRDMDFERLSVNIKRLKQLGTIHLHLDLIAGLPYEDMTAFKKSFNDVFDLNPDMLQLGFLKALKGSDIRSNADLYGIKYSEYPPYEVLLTNCLSYGDLKGLKMAERILDTYYNSGLALKTIEYSLRFFDSPFVFFHSFGAYRENSGYEAVNHSKMKMFEHLFEFLERYARLEADELNAAKEAIIYDILINDNIKTFPSMFSLSITGKQKEFENKLYNDKDTLFKMEPSLSSYSINQLRRSCNIVFFENDILDGFKKRQTVIFFHYLEKKGKAFSIS